MNRLRVRSFLPVAAVLFFATAPARAAGFEDVPAARSGVEFVHSFVESEARAYLYYSGFACGATCVADVNGDGLPDLYFSDGARENALYLNKGGMTFVASRQKGLEGGSRWGTGASLVDLDADGDLDLCQVNYDAPIQVFLNDGKGKFTERVGAFGLNVTDASLALSFADADNDGDLDAYLICNEYTRPGGRPKSPPFEMRDGVPVVKEEFEKHYRITKDASGKEMMDDYGRADYFFLNVGTRSEPRFRDVSKEAGVKKIGHGLSCVWFDFDIDGDLDLYVANDFLTPDRLYRNDLEPGRTVPKFVDVAAEVLPTLAWSSMGSDVADINNDGRPDLMVVDMSATSHFKSKLNMGEMKGQRRWVLENGWPRQAMRNHLYVHNGSSFYSESAWASGVASTDWSWAPKLADFDNDGRVDVFVTNGMTRNVADSDHGAVVGDLARAEIGRTKWDLYKDLPPMREKNRAHRNIDGHRFEDVSEAWGLDLEGLSYSAAHGDLDGDGDLDLVVSDVGKRVRLFENTAEGGNFLKVRLEGVHNNRMGIGAMVQLVDTEGRAHTRWMNPCTGFLSQNESVLHFGLGTAKPEELTVSWNLTGSTSLEDKVILEADATTVAVRQRNEIGLDLDRAAPWFPRLQPFEGIRFEHLEKPFDDFVRQPLLPGKLSQLGAPVAAGDVDGDGDLDLFAGGAAGQYSQLFVNEGGKFRKLVPTPFASDLGRECVEALWFDADGDEDLDLYVVNGSVEFGRGDLLYGDRLHLNEVVQGELTLEPAAGALPKLADSGSCVAAGDYDGDGDLDLFVGSRSEVGSYPVSPRSRLLRNVSSVEGGVRFEEATEQDGAALLKAGLVTDAEWSDVDGDGDPDLLLAVEWGPVRLFLNEKGKLVERTKEAGLAERTGWWSALAKADLDGDGDEDYLLGNVGWNTKYGIASSKKPAVLYYGDMDGSGERRLVEAKNAEGRLLPVRGKSCSTHAMPSLASKVGSFREFAVCDLAGLYTDARLAKAARYEATCFESGVLLNETPKGGAPRFRWVALPWEAQLSPVNDFAVGDFDGKQGVEIVGAQNHYTREPETGLWRGNPGFVARWTGESFVSIPPRESGIVLPGDTKSLAAGDFDGDGDLDLAAGQNHGALLTMKNVRK